MAGLNNHLDNLDKLENFSLKREFLKVKVLTTLLLVFVAFNFYENPDGAKFVSEYFLFMSVFTTCFTYALNFLNFILKEK